MKRIEVITNSGFWLADIQLKLFEAVNKYLSENNMSRTDFAKQLGVSKGYISQILNGDFNHRIEKMIEISLAIGKIPEINFHDLSDYLLSDTIPVKKTLSYPTKKHKYNGSYDTKKINSKRLIKSEPSLADMY